MPNKEISQYLAKLGKKGGKARMKTMSKEERSAVAKKAAAARWKEKKPA
jgi:phage gp16-like protein